MIIERVTVADAAALREIYGYYVEKTAVSFEYAVPSVAEFTDRIAAISARFPYIKAVENGITLGYAYATAYKPRPAYNRAVETTIYLQKELRRQGIGRCLYETLERALYSMGILNMNACITLPRQGENDPYLTDASMRFHAHMGFTQVGVFHRIGYKFNRWYDMTWMEKAIGPYTDSPAPVTYGEWTLTDESK